MLTDWMIIADTHHLVQAGSQGGFGRFGQTVLKPHFLRKRSTFQNKMSTFILKGPQIAVTHLQTVVYPFSFFRLEQNTWDLQQSRVATLENV